MSANSFSSVKQAAPTFCDLDPTHNLGKKCLIKDPLKRTKHITHQDGSSTTEIINICKSCYQRAYAQNQIDEGKSCDLDPTHNLGKKCLSKDPLKRTKHITHQDSSSTTEIIKICNTCYQKAHAEMQTNEGKTCDLDPAHNLGKRRLSKDPLKRTKHITDQDGSSTTEIINICNSCYLRAIKQLKQENKRLSEGNHSQQSTSSLDALASAASAAFVAIKQEHTDSEETYDGIEQVSSAVFHRGVDNSLPILQDPNDKTKSLLLQTEGPIDKIRCSSWQSLPCNLTRDEKTHITQQVQTWLHLNEENRSEYKRKLEDFFEVSIPIDEGPSRGLSVFAKQDIPQWTVVGPYAGVLHSTDASLEKAIKKQGSYNTLSYLFATRSSHRVVDAYPSGNVTSLANTGNLPGARAWKENNLGSLSFGKNLTFYISLREIKKGEELLLDYGPYYNPYQGIKTEKPDGLS